MTTDKPKANQLRPEPAERPDRQQEARSPDMWSSSEPIRLAGYEDDPAESHILRGID